jgi:predicted RNA polymerase sigma factor
MVSSCCPVAEAEGVTVGLALLSGLEQVLPNNHRLQAVRADLASRAGDVELARDSYKEALRLCGNDVEREYLAARLDAVR